jgi:putative ABC transport system ATP-binding protein
LQLSVQTSMLADSKALRSEPRAEPLIRLEEVSRFYQDGEMEARALDGVHLTIGGGEYLAVEGPSGSGKSTLLGIIGLLEAPSRGRYLLDGRPVESLSTAERARLRNQKIGFVFQSFNLISELTVFQNVELPLTYRGLDGAERRRLVEDVLDKVGMAQRARHYPEQLSGGQQQRVAVARAVVGRPRLLLADEPTGNLDTANADRVMQLIGDLHRSGVTVCIVTHNPQYAAQAQRMINLLDGRIVGERSQA